MVLLHWFYTLIAFCLLTTSAHGVVKVGADLLSQKKYQAWIKGKKIGLITNQTGVTSQLKSTKDTLLQKGQLHALFAPEHGLDGVFYANESVHDSTYKKIVPIYSLHGSSKRPSKKALESIDVLIYDIQDIGSRSYTYTTTLFYAMEEAAKHKVPVIVLDRPNPLGGLIVDGPMLNPEWRSFLGYINVPYCHGMTVGELALFFNAEYSIGCELKVVPMSGWKRSMTFQDTGLHWIPTSPHIPEADTPFYYPTTGILGELRMVNIGVGTTLPFKVIGAPWINADLLAKNLNKQKFSGVRFYPYHFKPFYGRFKGKVCHGVRIVITDPHSYKPVATQYLLIGMLKSLYPHQYTQGLKESASHRALFSKVNGTEDVYNIMTTQRYIAWPLKALHKERRKKFVVKREKYLLYL